MTTRFGCILTTILLSAFVGCRPPKDAEIVASVEPRGTIGANVTADTTRLQSAPPTSDAGTRALIAVLSTNLSTVGILRDDKSEGTHLDLVADLPAPGFALRARITPKPDLFCQVMLEPIAVADGRAISAAPWSVHAAFDEVRRRLSTLQVSKLPAMTQAQFARLRAEAAAAAEANKDPLLTSQEYVRVPRPISDEGPDRPYWTPPTEPSGLLGP